MKLNFCSLTETSISFNFPYNNLSPANSNSPVTALLSVEQKLPSELTGTNNVSEIPKEEKKQPVPSRLNGPVQSAKWLLEFDVFCSFFRSKMAVRCHHIRGLMKRHRN